MDALGAFLQLNGLVSGQSNTHPVTLPDFQIRYEQKDITADIKPYLISISYTDYLEGQSDELQIELEDVDGRWLRGWYPNQGDKLALSLGDQFTGLIDFGSFEIAEIEYHHPPSTVSIKALAAGISKAHRTLQPKAYEHTTLAKIVRTVAGRLKLSVTGTVKDIPIRRITQYQERDLEFLARLARDYGHSFKVTNKTLVFTANDELAKQAPVQILRPEELTCIRLRDLIKGVPTDAVVTGYDAKTKQTRTAKRKAKPLRNNKKQANGKQARATTSDTLKIIANKGESQEQVNARADAALAHAQENQVAGNVSLFGNALLVAGQTIELQQLGQFSGQYLVKQARHEYRRSSGYTTELEVKMVRFIDETAEQQEQNNAP